MKKINMETQGKYKLQKDTDLETQFHRRKVLKTVANAYKTEKEDFYQKYRVFQLHKWEILKCIKAKLLEQKIKEVEKANMLRKWINQATLRVIINMAYGKF